MKKQYLQIFSIILSVTFFLVSCKKEGCIDETAKNYSAEAEVDDGSCVYPVKGCNDEMATNYDANAEENDGSCEYLASTETKKRRVVIEDLTGVRCGWCPRGARNAENYNTAVGGKAYLIAIQSGSYAGPGPSGEPNTMITQYGQTFVSYFQPAGYPAASIGRTTNPKTYTLTGNSWKSVADGILNSNSPMNIGNEITWDESTRELSIKVELYYTSTETESNYINVALLENNITFPQQDYELIPNPYWDIDYVHDHVLRELLTGQWGDEVTSDLTVQGNRLQRSYTLTVDNDFDINNCDILVFTTKHKEHVYTAIKTAVIE